jgi:CubicO group peptidase (beta-lactamase class C family)
MSALLDTHLRPLVADSGVPGAAAAVVRGGDAAVLAVGRRRRGRPEPVDPHTPFATGSVTKTFTALLLAEAAARGEVGRTDPYRDHLPPSARPPAGVDAPTLDDLATHTAGLPRVPPNLFPRAAAHWLSDPYGGYGRDRLLRAAARARPRRDRAVPRYSTFGVGLLGQLLADTAGTDYPVLLAERVLRPLGMADSGAAPGAGDAPEAACGHRRGRPVAPWRFDALAGAGAVWTSAADMLAYLRAHIDPAGASPPPLADALAAVAEPLRPAGGRAGAKGTSLALVWNHRVVRGETLLWHTGGTGGFTVYAAFSPTARAGAAILGNATPTHRQPVVNAGRRLFAAAVYGDDR